MDVSEQINEAGGLDHIEQTADIVSAYVSNNHVQPGELPALITATYAALAGLLSASASATPAIEKPTPAQIKKSITPDALISFEDGKPYKTLRRHLTIKGLTPAAYRTKHGLPSDYPMTAASYSAQRSELAKSLGLGQQRRKFPASEPEAAEPVAEAAPKKAGRTRKDKVQTTEP